MSATYVINRAEKLIAKPNVLIRVSEPNERKK